MLNWTLIEVQQYSIYLYYHLKISTCRTHVNSFLEKKKSEMYFLGVSYY